MKRPMSSKIPKKPDFNNPDEIIARFVSPAPGTSTPPIHPDSLQAQELFELSEEAHIRRMWL